MKNNQTILILEAIQSVKAELAEAVKAKDPTMSIFARLVTLYSQLPYDEIIGVMEDNLMPSNVIKINRKKKQCA